MLRGKDLAIFVLSLAVAFLIGYLLAGRTSRDAANVYAEGGSANGIIVATTIIEDKTERLYVIDTDKKVICAYGTFQGKLRLCGVRSYKFDIEFTDSAKDKVIEDTRAGADYEYMKKKFEETGGN